MWNPRIDRNWRIPAHSQVSNLCVGTWHQSYNTQVTKIVSFVLGRVEAIAVRETNHDFVISYGRINLDDITHINPGRDFKSLRGLPDLLKRIKDNAVYDSVPVVCFKTGDKNVIWDGHHRLRTYRMAERKDIPAVIVEQTAGSGYVTISTGCR